MSSFFESGTNFTSTGRLTGEDLAVVSDTTRKSDSMCCCMVAICVCTSLSRRVNSVSRWAHSSTNIRISSSTGVVIIDCCFLSPFFGINEYNDYLPSSTIRHSHAVAREKYSERKYKSGLQMILALTGTETGYQGIYASWTLNCPKVLKATTCNWH